MNIHVAPSIAEASSELPALGEQLRAAYEAEIAAEKVAPSDVDLDRYAPYMAAYERCNALVTRIEAIQPKTFLDFGVKVLALAWARGDAWARGEDGFPNRDAAYEVARDTRILESLLPAVLHAAYEVARDTRILESLLPAVLQATGMMPSRADEAVR